MGTLVRETVVLLAFLSGVTGVMSLAIFLAIPLWMFDSAFGSSLMRWTPGLGTATFFHLELASDVYKIFSGHFALESRSGLEFAVKRLACYLAATALDNNSSDR